MSLCATTSFPSLNEQNVRSPYVGGVDRGGNTNLQILPSFRSPSTVASVQRRSGSAAQTGNKAEYTV